MAVSPKAKSPVAGQSVPTTTVAEFQRKLPATARKILGAEKLYALIDEATRDSAGQDVGDLLILDTIEKAMADRALKTMPGPGSVARGLLDAGAEWQPRVFTISKNLLYQAVAVEERGDWLELTPSSPGRNAIRLTALDLGTPAETPATEPNDTDIYILPRIVPVAQTNREKLDRLAMLVGVEPARSETVQAALPVPLPARPGRRVVVYDVGQANCNAVVDKKGRPLLFFDLGWPWSSDAAPSQIADLLTGNVAPVVLSHCDFDHWAYALQARGRGGEGVKVKPEALTRTWIARKPELKAHKLSPTHIAFANELLKAGKLLLWPAPTKTLDSAGLRLIACKPKDAELGDRNNSGLAMRIAGVGQAGGDVLLTGDADYASISNVDSKALRGLKGLVVPHHGGATITPPPAPARRNSPAVISAHERNTYGHPKASVIFKCISAGWGIACTLDRYPKCGGTKLIPNECFARCAGSRSGTCPQRLVGHL